MDNKILFIGQKVMGNFGAMYPDVYGKIIGFKEEKPYPFSISKPCAIIRWEASEDTAERIETKPIEDIHEQGWRSINGSPIGIFKIND